MKTEMKRVTPKRALSFAVLTQHGIPYPCWKSAKVLVLFAINTTPGKMTNLATVPKNICFTCQDLS